MESHGILTGHKCTNPECIGQFSPQVTLTWAPEGTSKREDRERHGVQQSESERRWATVLGSRQG